MKNLLVILLWLLLAVLDCFGQRVNPAHLGASRRAAAGGSCATSDTALAHDTLLEGWGSGAENTWTAWQNADSAAFNTSYDSSALTANKPTGACSTAIEVAVNNTAGEESLYWNNGSAITLSTTPTDFIFYIYITSGMDASETFTIVNINTGATGTGSVSSFVNLRNNAGTFEVQCEGGSSSTWEPLTASQWNKVTVHFDATAASSYINVNDGTNRTFTRLGTTWQYIHIGAPYGHAANEACTYVLDLFAVNTP